jgi:hypothetical protein
MQGDNDEKLPAHYRDNGLNFHQKCGLSQWCGQALQDMLRHPDFKRKLLQSDSATATPSSTCCGDLSCPLKKLLQLCTTFGSKGMEIKDWN